MLMHNIGYSDELWIAMRLLSAELARLIVSISLCLAHTHTHTPIHVKISHDVERYVKLTGDGERETGERREAIGEWLWVGELSKWPHACE